MTEKSSGKKMLLLSVVLLLASVMALIFATYSWFRNQRQLSTVTWIKTPIVLNIGSGNNHDIKYLDMGDIDVESGTYKDYVFCVYGIPVDNYSLQLAYTTNIAFSYKVYRTKITDSEDGVASTYTDENDDMKTEYFEKPDESATPVIYGKTLAEISDSTNTDTVSAHQSHNMSYGNEYGQNAINSTKVQSNAEPLYWLAEEDGTNVLKPKNKITTDDGTEAFLDYFIIRVSWDSNKVKNDKETDIVYLTASR